MAPLKTVIVAANLGKVRALRIEPMPGKRHPFHVEEIKLPEQEEGPERVSEIVTDQAGRFPTGKGTGMSTGEAHGLEEENETRLLRSLASRIESIVREEGCESWNLAIPKTIADRLIERLDKKLVTRLARTERADLTKLPVKELVARFDIG